MKDVSDILAKRLLRLESPFSRDWLSDFSNLMEFIQTNPLTTQVVESMREKKEEAHTSLIHHLKALLEDGKKCVGQIETRADSKTVLKPNGNYLIEMFFVYILPFLNTRGAELLSKVFSAERVPYT